MAYINKKTKDLVDIISSGAWKVPLSPKPVPLDFHFKTTLNYRIPRKFCEGTLRELVDL